MAKTFLDPSAFSDARDGIDLISNSIRKGLEYDALGGPEFVARVLTPPEKLSLAQAVSISSIGPGPPGDPSFWAQGIEALKNWFLPDANDSRRAESARGKNALIESKFSYIGRIEEIHGAFLSDPSCSTDMSGHPISDPFLLHQHTQFIAAGKEQEFPKPGDLVRVRLNKGDNGYDLQTGTHLDIYESMDAFESAMPHPRCESLNDLFAGDATGTGTISDYALSLPDLGPGPTEEANVIHEAYPNCSIELAEKIIQVSARLGIPDPGWLANLMNFETAGTFSPTVKGAPLNDAGDTAVGLIQFIPSTAKSLGTSTSALLQMTDIEQMDYVEKYLMQYRSRGYSDPSDVAMAVFFPNAMGQGADYSIYNYYVKKNGKTWADKYYLAPNLGIETAGNYAKLMMKNAKLPTGLT